MKLLTLLAVLLSSTFSLCTHALAEIKKNEEKSVRGCQGWGFYAEFLWAINHLQDCKTHNKIPVIYWDNRFAYHRPEGYNGSKNGWEYYFEPVSQETYDSEDTLIIKHWYNDYFSVIWHYDQYISNYILCDEEMKKSFVSVSNGCFPRGEVYPNNGMHLYSEKFRTYVKTELIDPYVKIKQPIKKKIYNFYTKKMVGKKTIGIHLRGQFIGNEVPIVSLEQIINEANKYAGPNIQFFIATDQFPLIEQAKKLLKGPAIFYQSERFATTSSPFPGKKLHPILGETVIIETMLLSACNHLIHTISNVSTAALYFNPKLQHTVLY